MKIISILSNIQRPLPHRCLTIMLSAVLCIAVTGCGRKGYVKEFNIIPEPTFLNQQHGTFSFNKSTTLCFINQGQNDDLVKYITSTLRQIHFRPNIVGERNDNCIVFRISDSLNPQLGEEGYLMEVREKGITITANTRKGLFYGFQTMMQMLPADIPSVRYSKIDIPQCTILDAPRFSWRGSLLDVSRHFFSVNDIKEHLDLMTRYKLNKFHWHLVDDHGWRIEIEKYPRLNDIGSYRVDRSGIPWGEGDPAKPGESADYGGYYTKEEIQDIVAYAAQRNIDVIPEIEIPGHCSEILAAYPQFACAGDDTTYHVQTGPYWPPRAILCAGNDSVLQFLHDIMDEVMALFPYEYIHVGGDEAVKDNWERCSLCQTRKAQLGLKDEDQLQSWMIMEVESYLRTKGRHIIAWDDIMNGGFSSDATIMSWQGQKPGIMAARHGNKVIMAPTQFCYLDYVQANAAYQPQAMPHTITLLQCYQFNPIPPELTGALADNIVGGQANLWTEYIETYRHAQYMLLPRLCAISECLWSQQEAKNWPHFRHKITWHKQRLSARGIPYCEGSFKPIFTAVANSDGTYTVTLDSEVEGTQMFYAIDTDPTAPNVGSLYVAPFKAHAGHLIRVASYYSDTLREEVYNFELLK